VAADGVGKTVRLADSQVPRPEGRHHALTHPDGPAVLLFDNFESDNDMLPSTLSACVFDLLHRSDEPVLIHDFLLQYLLNRQTWAWCKLPPNIYKIAPPPALVIDVDQTTFLLSIPCFTVEVFIVSLSDRNLASLLMGSLAWRGYRGGSHVGEAFAARSLHSNAEMYVA
jgi:hypothetical protein